jgi:hypothetical protein
MIQLWQISAQKISSCKDGVPNYCLVMVYRSDSLVLAGLEAHRDRAQVVEVFEQGSINLFLQAQNNRYRKSQRESPVPESVAHGSKWLSRSRGGMQVQKVNIASSSVDHFSQGHQQFALLNKLGHLRATTIL